MRNESWTQIPMTQLKKCLPTHFYTRLRDAQQQFAYVLIATIVMIVIVSIFLEPGVHRPPPYFPSKRYVTCGDCMDMRRFGNQLFNYASLQGIAKRNNMTAVLSHDYMLREYFNLSIIEGDVTKTLGAALHYTEFGRRACAYDLRTEKLGGPFGYFLHGYYQSWMYFRNIEKELRKELILNADITDTARAYLDDHIPQVFKNTKQEYIRVGVHVRRGDQANAYFVRYGYTTADAAYLERAMKYFRDKHKHIQFVVCSDDMEWSKDFITGDDVIFSENHSAVVDFAILTLCDHTIMTVGSFGWWAAWFVNGTTLYYKDWPRPISRLEYDVDKRQYFPPHWIPM